MQAFRNQRSNADVAYLSFLDKWSPYQESQLLPTMWRIGGLRAAGRHQSAPIVSTASLLRQPNAIERLMPCPSAIANCMIGPPHQL